MTRSTHSSKPNGHACALTVHDLAAPVDAGGILAAPAAIPFAAGANPDAYAEAAAAGDRATRPPKKGAAPRSHKEPPTSTPSKLAAPAKPKSEPPPMQAISSPMPA